ncbi:hypothetical protein [Streptomyces parvulus]|uniref:hypothetical protein n=1 Tax=Streptomyces parvulus TaxID=146923 RepID=UPI00379BE2B1
MELERLEVARLSASHTLAVVADARARLATAIAEDMEAQATLNRAIDTVLYGPHDDAADTQPITARELSSPLAQQHWPTPPAAPGG